MRLLWDDRLIARTTTRDQWRAMDRWRRRTMRTLRAREDEYLSRLSDLVTYGTTHPERARDICREIMDRAVNPPLLRGPMFS